MLENEKKHREHVVKEIYAKRHRMICKVFCNINNQLDIGVTRLARFTELSTNAFYGVFNFKRFSIITLLALVDYFGMTLAELELYYDREALNKVLAKGIVKYDTRQNKFVVPDDYEDRLLERLLLKQIEK